MRSWTMGGDERWSRDHRIRLDPAEWIAVLMDYTIGTGIVLWHFLRSNAGMTRRPLD